MVELLNGSLMVLSSAYVAAGFASKPSNDAIKETSSCYSGKASLDSIADSWKNSNSGFSQKTENLGVLEDFQQWAREMPFSERVSWAVGGMVLTAGLLFARFDNYFLILRNMI